MQTVHFDSSKVVPYIALKPSAQAGCVNVILPPYEQKDPDTGQMVTMTDRVFSAHGDDRDPGSDGPWEQFQISGNVGTARADGVLFSWLIVPVEKLP